MWLTKLQPRTTYETEQVRWTDEITVRLLDKFAKVLDGREPRELKLREAGRRRLLWVVDVVFDTDGHMCLGHGWEQFARAHDLRLGHFLILSYDGHTVLTVKVFDGSMCHRDYQHNDDTSSGSSSASGNTLGAEGKGEVPPHTGAEEDDWEQGVSKMSNPCDSDGSQKERSYSSEELSALDGLSKRKRKWVDECIYARGIRLEYPEMRKMISCAFAHSNFPCCIFVHKLTNCDIGRGYMRIPKRVVDRIEDKTGPMDESGRLLLMDDPDTRIEAAYKKTCDGRLVIQGEFRTYATRVDLKVDDVVVICFQKRTISPSMMVWFTIIA